VQSGEGVGIGFVKLATHSACSGPWIPREAGHSFRGCRPPGYRSKATRVGYGYGNRVLGVKSPGGTAPVAQGYAQAAQALGVDPARIVVLDTLTDTAQEAYAVREFLGTEARFVLVTSASHRRRSVRHFERAGLSPIASPTHYLTGGDGPDRLRYWVPSAGNLRKTERAVHENLGLLALELDHRGR